MKRLSRVCIKRVATERGEIMTEKERKKEQKKGFAKIIENALRYRAVVSYMNGGCKSAASTLNRDCKNNGINKRISEDRIGYIKRGIATELLFYALFGEKLSLTPTLDAGCAFDFVGMMTTANLTQSNSFVRIDVTRSIEAKRQHEPTTCYGRTCWPFRIAHVCDKAKRVDWYDEIMTGPLFKTSFPQKSSVHRQGMNIAYRKSLSFVKTRREALEAIECAHSLDDALADIRANTRLSNDDRERLCAEAIFFATYKYALNIVPALSCGDLCDFIGEHNGELVRYRILTCTKGYFKNEYPVLEQLSKTFRYKIALFDTQTKMFAFYDWNDWQLFDDMPDLE